MNDCCRDCHFWALWCLTPAGNPTPDKLLLSLPAPFSQRGTKAETEGWDNLLKANSNGVRKCTVAAATCLNRSRLNTIAPDSLCMCQNKRKTITPSLYSHHIYCAEKVPFFVQDHFFFSKGFFFLSSPANIPFTWGNLNRFKPLFRARVVVQTCYSYQLTMPKHTGAKPDWAPTTQF